MSNSRVRTTLAIGVLGILAGSCELKEPFVRANPYDPDGIYSFALTGPDSLHFIGQRATAQLTTDPPLPPGPHITHWEAFPAGDCLPDGSPLCQQALIPLLTAGADGEFVVGNASAKYLKVVVAVSFGEVTTGHEIMVGQKAVTLALSCSPWTLPQNPCDAAVRRDSTLLLHPRMTDAAGAVVGRPYYATARAQVTSRDPAVVAVLPQGTAYDALGRMGLRAMGAGSAWVVMRVDEAIDSVQVTVIP